MITRKTVAASLGMLLLLFIGCSSLKQVLYTGDPSPMSDVLAMLDTSGYPSNVFIGLSGPYSTQEKMVQEGILSCARLIALSEAIAVDNRIVTQWDSKKGLRSFATEGNAYYDDSTIAGIVNRLEVVSVSFDRDAGAIVVAQDLTLEAQSRPPTGGYGSDSKPLWLREIPENDGYRFGVGISGPYQFLNDSLEAADFAAAQDLLDRNTDQLYSKGYTKVTSDRNGEVMETGMYQASKGILEGFMVVARYFDIETGTYWSLAAVPK